MKNHVFLYKSVLYVALSCLCRALSSINNVTVATALSNARGKLWTKSLIYHNNVKISGLPHAVTV